MNNNSAEYIQGEAEIILTPEIAGYQKHRRELLIRQGRY